MYLIMNIRKILDKFDSAISLSYKLMILGYYLLLNLSGNEVY